MNMFCIGITPSQLAKSWGVYTLIELSTNKLIYIGYEPVCSLFTISTARANPLFHDIVIKDAQLAFTLESIHPDKLAARNAYSMLIHKYGMPDMITRQSLYKGVVCLETGERFKNITEAARAHGIGQGNLSNHLKGRTGYASLKGRTYRRFAGNG